jgi:hypothetical protein
MSYTIFESLVWIRKVEVKERLDKEEQVLTSREWPHGSGKEVMTKVFRDKLVWKRGDKWSFSRPPSLYKFLIASYHQYGHNSLPYSTQFLCSSIHASPSAHCPVCVLCKSNQISPKTFTLKMKTTVFANKLQKDFNILRCLFLNAEVINVYLLLQNRFVVVVLIV